MKRPNFKAALLAIALGAAASGVQAQSATPGAYLGGMLGQGDAKKDFSCSGVPDCKHTSTAWKIFAGYQFNRNLAVEAGYTDLGRIHAATGTTDEKFDVGLGEATGVLSVPFGDKVSLYGKLGGYYARTTDTITAGGSTTDRRQNNGGVTFGAGMQFCVTNNLAIRGEYQRYSKVGGGIFIDIDYNTFTAGALWKF